jgi:uncharacterized protein YjbI with pentapeptide repeats
VSQPKVPQIIIEFRADILLRTVSLAGVGGWNALLNGLRTQGLTPPAWSSTDCAPAIVVLFDFSGADFSNKIFNGIDIGPAWLSQAAFHGASLQNARIGCCPHTSFRNGDLTGADFSHGDVTGCDFSGATTHGACFDGASYDPSDPPVGLPDELLEACTADHEDSLSPAGHCNAPVLCRATIDMVRGKE